MCRMQIDFRIKFFKFETEKIKKWRDNTKLDVFKEFEKQHGEKFALVGQGKSDFLEYNKTPMEELKKWAKKFKEVKGSM